MVLPSADLYQEGEYEIFFYDKQENSGGRRHPFTGPLSLFERGIRLLARVVINHPIQPSGKNLFRKTVTYPRGSSDQCRVCAALLH